MERPNDRPTTPSSIRQDDHQTKQPVPSNNTNDLTTTQPLDEKIEVISTKQDAPDDEYPSGIKLVAIVVALILAIFLASLDMTIVATAIPKITDEFGGLQDVSWYGAAFFMANGGLQSSWGKAYKYFPLKWTFLAAVFVFEVGSLICGAAPTSTALIIGRALAGVGAAGLGTGAYTIIAFAAPPSKRAMYTGFVGMSYGIASVCGPLLGGVFSDYSTWRWCFYMNLPVGAITVIIILLFFHAPAAAKPVEATWTEKFLQMDPVGVTLVMAAIVTYILAFQYAGHDAPWNSGLVIGLIVAFSVLYIVFGVWEYFQGERAMLVPRLLKGRPVWVSCAYAFFFSGSYFLTIYYLPIYFQSVKGVSPTMSGVRNLPLILGVTVAMILSGFFVSATGIAAPLKVGGAAVATIATGLIYTFDDDTTTGEWIGYQLLGGIGWGVSYQLPIIVAQSSADPADVSTVTAMVLFFMNLGGSSFISAGQAAFVNTLLSRLPTTAPGVDPLDVVATGATDIRPVFSAAQVPGILEAYMGGIKLALILPIAATGIAFVVSAFSKWQKLPSSATKEAVAV
ncbi:major facilitator superfamily-domain-containing protein [Plectosphaerella cucumerina]|uniref:Major facilitator superfamily-domain-containing protein n=1 Tax=Plectosphaerella cucumerina TaxID=40658 RepID=A0A8K0TMX9_9PEZI|nr:major facilitator superfamily-domain-containing protein [Plectosphaerella cucumerina]